MLACFVRGRFGNRKVWPQMPKQRIPSQSNHREGMIADTIASHVELLTTRVHGESKKHLLSIQTLFEDWHEKFNRAIDKGEV